MLLSYEDALSVILESTRPIAERVEFPLSADGKIHVLAEGVQAQSPNPRFDNSSVDGYAIHGDDLRRIGEPLQVSMTVAAGEVPTQGLTPGAVARIFTGAQLPSGTSAVAMQEDVEVGDRGILLEEPLREGEGLRRAGSDFAIGTMLMEPGTPITPGVAGLLASQGIVKPSTFRLPNCLFVTTGDEIVPPEKEPGPTQVRDVIALMLGEASAKYCTSQSAFASDDPDKLRGVLAGAAEKHDAIIVAGGASVGDRDFVARVVASLGTVEFHGINIRPGKPLLFGLIAGKPILCLPGNPASAYVCFHLFGIPLLRRLAGWSSTQLLWFEAPYNAEHEPEPRDVFSRVTLENGSATPVHEQASFGLRSLGAARALARLPGGKRVEPGSSVKITLL